MFFVLSKLFWFIAAPTNQMVILLCCGALLTLSRWNRFGRWITGAAVIGLVLIAASPLPRALVRPLEDRFAQVPETDIRKIDGIVVLGGAIGSGRGQVRFSEAASRMTYAAALAKKHPMAKVVFTGGSTNLIAAVTRTEADSAAQFFAEMGIEPERVILENKARNTYENGTFTARMIAPKPGERWILITSAYHMPRSIGVFRKAGLNLEAYPVDFNSSGTSADFTRPARRFAYNMNLADDTVKEWLGLIAYRLAGYTDTVLPGP
jgi:uncharacterized SAM-binding protein YcdF (DUF218 family)